MDIIKVYVLADGFMDGKIGFSLSKAGRKVRSLGSVGDDIERAGFAHLSHEGTQPDLPSSVLKRFAILEIDIVAIKKIGI